MTAAIWRPLYDNTGSSFTPYQLLLIRHTVYPHYLLICPQCNIPSIACDWLHYKHINAKNWKMQDKTFIERTNEVNQVNVVRKLRWPLTCVSSSRILCRVSLSSAWASASRSLTLISSSCSSLKVFFLGLSFQRLAVRAKWRWGEVLQSVHLSITQ